MRGNRQSSDMSIPSIPVHSGSAFWSPNGNLFSGDLAAPLQPEKLPIARSSVVVEVPFAVVRAPKRWDTHWNRVESLDMPDASDKFKWHVNL